MTTIRIRITRLVAVGGIVAGAAVVPTSAFAACGDYAGGNCGRASSAPAATIVNSSPTRHNDGLPFTGGDIVGLSLIGIGAVAGGAALVRSNRRKADGT